MQSKIIFLFILTLTFLLSSEPLFAKTKSIHWRIRNESWNETFELSYQNFIHTLGVARKNGLCYTTDQCLKSPAANPYYYDKNPTRLENIFSDCADFPYILRAYFSWMNDLPFSFTTDLAPAPALADNKSDIRYSKFGNLITGKRQVNNFDNVNKVFQNINDSISSGSFRTDASKNDTGDLFRDSYPVDIDRKAIVPGTLLYDPNGHVAVVYEITSSGKILLIDAHPDNSLSVITYGEKFARGRVQIGGGFSNFRPYSIYNDTLTPKSNAELSGYSLIQYQKGPFIFKGKEVTFYQYVRSMMADGVIIYNPISEFSDLMDELCQDVKYREDAVNASLLSNLQNQTHPQSLPENIYGADGDWEAYATPARDARLKESVREIKEYLTKVITGSDNNFTIQYLGADIVSDLREIYLAKTKSCTVSPTPNSTINLDLVLINLFSLSFDPYHCPELRWGLPDKENCLNGNSKMDWFNAEQGLRNRIDRDNNIRTDYDVKTLPSAPVSQVEKPDLSLDQLLQITRGQ